LWPLQTHCGVVGTSLTPWVVALRSCCSGYGSRFRRVWRLCPSHRPHTKNLVAVVGDAVRLEAPLARATGNDFAVCWTQHESFAHAKRMPIKNSGSCGSEQMDAQRGRLRISLRRGRARTRRAVMMAEASTKGLSR